MSDRLKRRKKTVEEGKGETKPAPLQPAYFDKPPTAKEASDTVHPSPTDRSVPAAYDSEAHDALPQSSSPERSQRQEQTRASETRHSEARRSTPHSPESRPSRAEALELPQPTADGEEPARAGTAGATPGSDNSDVQRRRRRRGRGGRGRGRNPSAQPVVATPPGVELLRPEPGEPVPFPEREQLTPVGAEGGAGSSRPAVSKGIVVLAIGLPGSGKSSWFKRHEVSPLSSDLLRALLFDDPTEQRFQDLVFFQSPLHAEGPPHRAASHKLGGCHQPYAPRASRLDQAG
jgi:hypothetical protein